MSTILDEIVEHKKAELEAQQKLVPLERLQAECEGLPVPLNLSGSLLGERVRLIAEVKKASPSKGLLSQRFDPAFFALTYANNGAAAVSVLTDSHFQGTLDHLTSVKTALASHRTPILRKDFILEPYHVYQSRVFGADALLLIVSILSQDQLIRLLTLCRTLWIQALVEVHNELELTRAIEAGAEIIGINNRDLHTFETDLTVTKHLVSLVPRGKIIVSESGISTINDIALMKEFGVNAVLVGEALVTAHDLVTKVRELALGDAAYQETQ